MAFTCPRGRNRKAKGRDEMAVIRPFRALRPRPDRAADVASVPYDVVTTEEARVLAEGNPLSFLHVIRPEIDLEPGTDPHADSVYQRAAENLRKLRDDGVLVQEDESSLYVYRLREGEHEQIGLAACCSVGDYEDGGIRKHEYTRKDKEDDRLRHMLTLSAHAGPVLLAYRGVAECDSLIEGEAEGQALYDFTAPDGVRHTLWRAARTEKIVRAFKAVPLLYIADGHHRAAGAARVKEAMLQKRPGAGVDEEFRFFLAVVFPSDRMRILPYNRYVSDLGGMNEAEFLAAVGERFELTDGAGAEPREKGSFGMYLGGTWYALRLKSPSGTGDMDPVSVLDLSVFAKNLLEPVLGIGDQKKDERIDFIGGADSVVKIERRVDREGGVGFTFYPVSVDELLDVADAGMIMPPKSTWFSPKLRSGLLIHQF
jgi:uncharacterized protein (DUF1015 family)